MTKLQQQFIQIGKVFGDDEAVVIDLLRLIATRLLIFAASGGGKSWLLRRILEQSFRLIHQIILDVEGDFYTLREKFAYVLVSNNRDLKPEIPLNAKKGAEMARMIMQTRMNIIIDLSSLDDDDERIEFVRDFATEMLNLPKKLNHPCLCVIDEVHRFCDDDERIASTQALKNLATAARKRGICPIYATQALAQVNKRAVASCLNKIIGVAGLDVDIARAANNLGFSPKRKSDIEDLEPGEFFVRGPAMNRKVQKIIVGDVQTTHPDATKEQEIVPPSPPTDEAMARAVKMMSEGLKKEKEGDSEAKEAERIHKNIDKYNDESEVIRKYKHDADEAIRLVQLRNRENEELRKILDDKNKAMEELSTSVAKANTELDQFRKFKDLLREMAGVPSELAQSIGAAGGAMVIDTEQGEVTVIERQVTKPDIDESTLEGRLAMLGAEGFFNEGKGIRDIWDVLSKRYTDMDALYRNYENFRKNYCHKGMEMWLGRPYGFMEKSGNVFVITELGRKYLHKRTVEVEAK